jgi:hypothetical protein
MNGLLDHSLTASPGVLVAYSNCYMFSVVVWVTIIGPLWGLVVMFAMLLLVLVRVISQEEVIKLTESL